MSVRNWHGHCHTVVSASIIYGALLEVRCSACGNTGHNRRSKLCPLNSPKASREDGEPEKKRQRAGHDDALRKQLECQVCLEFMMPPIRQCPNGHTLCDAPFASPTGHGFSTVLAASFPLLASSWAGRRGGMGMEPAYPAIPATHLCDDRGMRPVQVGKARELVWQGRGVHTHAGRTSLV